MKFMLISYATKDWEAGKPPDPRLLAAIPRLYEKMPKTGALLSTGGLAPSLLGAMVRVSGGKVLVTDGPFAETKEIVGGYAIVEASSKEEAIEIARGFWQLHVDVLGPSYEGGGEIRQMFHQEECALQSQQVSVPGQLVSGPEHRRLEKFAGKWKTEGTIPWAMRPLLAALAILVAWTLIDFVLHGLLLAPIYDTSPNLWRPSDQLNVALIYSVIFVLIGVFVGIYELLVRPWSLRAGLVLGALFGFALGFSAGFGTYIHMPIPLALAWGWFLGGWLKGLAAGAIVGAVIIDSRSPGSSAPQPLRQVS